tara:strand:+ start:690 stop:935 length:246 start_codon:yes stop_codon:yes gene_type:complete
MSAVGVTLIEIISFFFWATLMLGPLFRMGDEEGSEAAAAHCSFDGCRALTMKSTEFCWKHQDAKPHISDGPAWWEEGGGAP